MPNENSLPQVNEHDFQMLILSEDCKKENQSSELLRWYRVERIDDRDTGLDAVIYKNIHTNEIVDKVAGTEIDSYDTINDIKLGLGDQTSSSGRLLEIVEELQNENPNNTITLTGHSLGGADANFVANSLKLNAVTFDQPGFTKGLYEKSNGSQDSHIKQIISEPNAVNYLGDKNENESYIYINGFDENNIRNSLKPIFNPYIPPDHYVASLGADIWSAASRGLDSYSLQYMFQKYKEQYERETGHPFPEQYQIALELIDLNSKHYNLEKDFEDKSSLLRKLESDYKSSGCDKAPQEIICIYKLNNINSIRNREKDILSKLFDTKINIIKNENKLRAIDSEPPKTLFTELIQKIRDKYIQNFNSSTLKDIHMLQIPIQEKSQLRQELIKYLKNCTDIKSEEIPSKEASDIREKMSTLLDESRKEITQLRKT